MCGRNIEQERLQLNLNVCKVCAHQGIGQIQRKGIMVYGSFIEKNTTDYSDVDIFVIDEGRIVQEGTHKSLQQSPGLYRDLCLNQLKEVSYA